jgi:hypothetical protein
MINDKEKSKTYAKIGRTWSTKNQKENPHNPHDNFIIGVTNQTTNQNSE